MEWYTSFPYAFLSGAESSEVLSRQRVRVGEELYHYPTKHPEADGNVEEDSRVIGHRRLITDLGFCLG